MLTLFHAPGLASSRILWLLEELGTEYELVQVAAGPALDGTQDARNPHPHGYAPALVHDGELVCESGAVVLHRPTSTPGRAWPRSPGRRDPFGRTHEAAGQGPAPHVRAVG